jgi:hypothetical protein
MGAIVVQHQMDIQVGGNCGARALQNAEELGAAMAPVGVPDHIATADVQGSGQGGNSVAAVVMG